MNIYYFNDLGDYDIYNPAYYFDRENAKELIFYIAQAPYCKNKISLYKKINLSNDKIDDILNGLKFIEAISENNKGYFKVNFPCFYENDVKNIITSIEDNIVSLVDKIKDIVCKYNYNKNELYHILCNGVFDKYAFDFLTRYDIITSNKVNKGNRNYIIIGYEDNNYVNNYSKKLLCSNNKFKCKNITFNSFGDTDGDRKDFFRYFRLRQQNIEKFAEIDEYYNSINCDQNKLKTNIENYILSINEDESTSLLLERLRYIKGNKVIVPIIKENEHIHIGENVMKLIIDDILMIFNKISKLDISPNKNNVPIKDTLNEVWHILFGLINEELIRQNIVASPIYIEGEGRYLKCIYINDKVNL